MSRAKTRLKAAAAMDRLLEYSGHHPWLAALAVVTALAVVYELRLRLQNAASLAPQEAIRLMNQGATVLDVRTPQAYAEGHINGARHFDAVQILNASDALKPIRSDH